MVRSRSTQSLHSILAMGLLVGLLVASSTRAAVTYSVAASVDSGNSLTSLQIGDRVTFDITIRSDGEPIYGVGASAYGYSSVLNLDSGLTGHTLLSQICIPSAGCFRGLDHSSLAGGVTISNEGTRDESVRFANAISLVPSVVNGAMDPGIVTGIPGDPQVRLVFEAAHTGQTMMGFGTRFDLGDAQVFAGGELRETAPILFSIGVEPIPEPGAVLLMGSGLLVVALRSRGRGQA